MDFFTADLHLYHENVLRFCNRPFTTLAEMYDQLVGNINNAVQKNDRLFILGDLLWRHSTRRMTDFRAAINCKQVFLVRGNHDTIALGDTHKWFAGISDHQSVGNFVLQHHPLVSWNRMQHGTVHLHGHSHGNLPHDIFRLRFDIGVDCFHYRPVSQDELEGLVTRAKDLGERLQGEYRKMNTAWWGRPAVTWRKATSSEEHHP